MRIKSTISKFIMCACKDNAEKTLMEAIDGRRACRHETTLLMWSFCTQGARLFMWALLFSSGGNHRTSNIRAPIVSSSGNHRAACGPPLGRSHVALRTTLAWYNHCGMSRSLTLSSCRMVPFHYHAISYSNIYSNATRCNATR